MRHYFSLIHVEEFFLFTGVFVRVDEVVYSLGFSAVDGFGLEGVVELERLG